MYELEGSVQKFETAHSTEPVLASRQIASPLDCVPSECSVEKYQLGLEFFTVANVAGLLVIVSGDIPRPVARSHFITVLNTRKSVHSLRGERHQRNPLGRIEEYEQGPGS
ncbi:hypothetical protein FVE85_7158 [Porphyridium purpureum]|uniref:Uncharacterized protein n=1 Tax=Porphyridium purpureum TaxID=35688 RepID=A0A5J4Z9Z5_PORPP|nr:hypothetical protein FVE85_7158 [Porphyridium purpureum]|eukprot:POR2099..scf295_1